MRFRPGILLAALIGVATAWLASPAAEARPSGPAARVVEAGSGATAYLSSPVRGPAKRGLALLAHVAEIDPSDDPDDEVKVAGRGSAGPRAVERRCGGWAGLALPGRLQPAHLATGPPAA